MSSKIFGTLTLIVLAIACFIGLKNKAAYQTEIDNRIAVEEKLVKTKARLELAQKNLQQTQTAHDEMKAEIPKVTAQRDEQLKVNEELTASKTSKAAEVEANKARLDQAREKTSTLGNIKDLAQKMGSMISESKGLDDTIVTSEAKLASLTAENTGVENKVAQQRSQAEMRSKGESFPSLKTHISSVFPNWGFVTIAAGNTAGVITNSTLDVVRNDEVIAKLLVTAVERNTASASIIPDTVKADTVLQTGDSVVPGAKVSPATAPNSAAPKTTPAPAN